MNDDTERDPWLSRQEEYARERRRERLQKEQQERSGFWAILKMLLSNWDLHF